MYKEFFNGDVPVNVTADELSVTEPLRLDLGTYEALNEAATAVPSGKKSLRSDEEKLPLTDFPVPCIKPLTARPPPLRALPYKVKNSSFSRMSVV